MIFGLLTLVVAAQASNWFDGECGVSKYDDAGRIPFDQQKTFNDVDSHIIGGWESRPGEFPWQLELQYFGSITCGGVLISDQWALTAANCIFGRDVDSFTVIVGQTRLGEAGTQTVRLSSMEYHANFHETNRFENDIAILKFAEKVTLNENVVPACKPSGSYDNRNGITTGWGRLAMGGSFPQVLHAVNNPVMSDRDCIACNAQDIILPGMLCHGICGENTRATCNGDSGSPLVVANEDNVFDVVGTTSWYGIGGCASHVPPVFSSTSFYTEWIDARINRDKIAAAEPLQ